jgi:AraC-like DNA-binding protein
MHEFILPLQVQKLDVKIHHHSAFQIVFTKDIPFHSNIGGELSKDIHGFVIKPQVPHACSTEHNTTCVLNIEPYSQTGIRLKKMFKRGQDKIVFETPDAFLNHFEINGKIEADKWPDSVIHFITKDTDTDFDDERITQIISFIHKNFSEMLTPTVFSKQIFLSPSRLTALFKEQTGSSLSRYILWTRLRYAIERTLSGKDLTLTEIAYEAGFYDLPQLDKYMYQMFGVPPKGLKQNSVLIQVL